MNSLFNLTEFENEIAVVNEYGEQYYYGDLINVSNQLGSFLYSEDKNLVMILTKNNIETIAGYLAGVQSDNVVMLVDANLNKELVSNLVNVYSPDFVWGPENNCVPENNNITKVFRYKGYELSQCACKHKSKLHSSLTMLLSTSGSTGSPKLVRLTKDNLIANARSIGTYLDLNRTEKPVTNLPIHYSYGLSVINSHLMVGATILLTDTPIVKKEFWDFFKSAEGTSLAGVPYTYEMLKRIGFSKMDLPSLRYMTQAGGKMNSQLVLEYAKLSREKNFNFYVMYGATEATARMAYLSPRYNTAKAGSIGKAIPFGKLHLIDETGNIINKPNVEGELVYQGANVMMGYAHCREDLAKNDELSGVLKTGDLAYFDQDGFYYISGRKNRFLKISGNRISLAEIERYLQSQGHYCFCGGEDDLLLIAYHNNGTSDNQGEIFKKIRGIVFSKYKIPIDLIRVFQINNIPRNSSMKINYPAIFSNHLNEKGCIQ